MADINVLEIKLEESIENSEIQEKLERTKDEINAEIQEITDRLVEEFEVHLKEGEGYQNIFVKSEQLITTEDYFQIKIIQILM